MTLTEVKIKKNIKKLTEAISNEVAKRISTVSPDQSIQPKWLSAFVETRKTSDSETWKAKFRVILADGTLYKMLDTTEDMDDLFREIWKIKKSDPFLLFYGLKVSVTNDGVSSTEFDDDPNCFVDPEWYRT